jgi:hypothetical protein
MSDSRQKVRAFVGYQLRSDYHTDAGLSSLIAKVKRRLADQGATLEVTYGRFPAGDLLWPAVVDAIRHCDVAIFDISENNPNVLIEVGLAGGFRKRLLLLKNDKSGERHPKPSDIGHIYISYPSADGIDSEETVKDLERGIQTYLSATEDPERFARAVWGFDDFDDVLVACSELEEPEKRQHPEPWEFIYLSKYGDLDTLLEVEATVHELFPNAHIEHRTGNEVLAARSATAYSGNLVIVGGPDYNALAKHFEKACPVEYGQAGADNNITLCLRATGETLTPFQNSAEPEHVTDYGFFAKFPNPYSPQRRLVMIGGAHTYGVFGAVRAFSFSRRVADPVALQNCKFVVDRFGPDPSFVAVLEVHGVGSSIPTPRVDSGRLWAIPPSR